MWLVMAAPLLLLAPNMSSSTLLENGGGAQKRKQQSKQNDMSIFTAWFYSLCGFVLPSNGSHSMLCRVKARVEWGVVQQSK